MDTREWGGGCWYREQFLADLVRICAAGGNEALTRRLLDRAQVFTLRHRLSMLSARAALEDTLGHEEAASRIYEEAARGWEDYGYPFDTGAGSIRANLAVDPTPTFDETAANYFLSAADPLGRINLNTPSINAPLMPGIVTTSRTAVNVSAFRALYRVTVDQPAGASISVTPRRLTVNPGASTTLNITINGEGLSEGQYFGRINLVPVSARANPVSLPVAFFKTQGDVALSHTCAATTIPVGTATACSVTATNFAPVETGFDLSLRGPLPSRAEGPERVGAGCADRQRLHRQRDPFSLGGAADRVDRPGVGPAGGYLPLSLFGIAPIGGMGDETLVNFNTPAYSFGSETRRSESRRTGTS